MESCSVMLGIMYVFFTLIQAFFAQDTAGHF